MKKKTFWRLVRELNFDSSYNVGFVHSLQNEVLFLNVLHTSFTSFLPQFKCYCTKEESVWRMIP